MYYSVLQGCNPAWSSNSGKFRTKVLSETLEDRLLSTDEVSAKSQIQATIESPYFNEWWEQVAPAGDNGKTLRGFSKNTNNFMPVALLSNAIIYDKPAILRLTEETAYNKKLKHDIDLGDYVLIQTIIDDGTLTQDSDTSWKSVYSINNINYKVSFKVTSNNEYILNTFHKLRDEQLKK